MYYRYSGQYGVVWVAQKGVCGAFGGIDSAYWLPWRTSSWWTAVQARHTQCLRMCTHGCCLSLPCFGKDTGMCVLHCGWQGCTHHMYSRACRGTREPGCHVMLSCHVVVKAEHRMGHIGGRGHLYWAKFTPAILRMPACSCASGCPCSLCASPSVCCLCLCGGEFEWCVQQEWATGPPLSLLSHPACDSPHVTRH